MGQQDRERGNKPSFRVEISWASARGLIRNDTDHLPSWPAGSACDVIRLMDGFTVPIQISSNKKGVKQ